MARVSAILVNYHTATDIHHAVRSLLDQGLPCEIIVVDNSADDTEAQALRAGLPEGVRLIVNPVNTGFACACNQAYAQSTGEAVLLLNPDAALLPGALATLCKALGTDPKLGAVGPKVYWDAAQTFALPPSTFPSVADYCEVGLSRHSRLLRGWRTRRFRAWSWRYWQRARPVPVAALSGGHVLLRRSAVEAAGGLFDERFFMYWEDSDLMQRLRHAGYRLHMIPAARALHAYTHTPEKGRMIGVGWPQYFEKHLQRSLWVRLVQRLQQFPAPPVSTHWSLADLDPQTGDLRLPVPVTWRDGWLLELSPNPDFIPAMGRWGQGDTVCVAASLHGRFRGEFYARLGPQKAWPWQMQCWRFFNGAS